MPFSIFSFLQNTCAFVEEKREIVAANGKRFVTATTAHDVATVAMMLETTRLGCEEVAAWASQKDEVFKPAALADHQHSSCAFCSRCEAPHSTRSPITRLFSAIVDRFYFTSFLSFCETPGHASLSALFAGVAAPTGPDAAAETLSLLLGEADRLVSACRRWIGGQAACGCCPSGWDGPPPCYTCTEAVCLLFRQLLLEGWEGRWWNGENGREEGHTSKQSIHRHHSLMGITPFLAACRAGDVRCMRLLVSAGCDVGAFCVAGRSALHVAAGYGRLEATRYLLNELRFDVDIPSCAPLLAEAPHLFTADSSRNVDSLTDDVGAGKLLSSDNLPASMQIFHSLTREYTLVKEGMVPRRLLPVASQRTEQNNSRNAETMAKMVGQTALHLVASYALPRDRNAIASLLLSQGASVSATTDRLTFQPKRSASYVSDRPKVLRVLARLPCGQAVGLVGGCDLQLLEPAAGCKSFVGSTALCGVLFDDSERISQRRQIRERLSVASNDPQAQLIATSLVAFIASKLCDYGADPLPPSNLLHKAKRIGNEDLISALSWHIGDPISAANVTPVGEEMTAHDLNPPKNTRCVIC